MEVEDECTTKPNWLELPRDITINILQRLNTLELVTIACVVCPLWWKICNDPLMWCTVDMMTNISLSYSDYDYSSRLEKICRYAVDRSCGHLKDIYINKFGTDDLLRHIANSASHLRCIRLEGCHEISCHAFKEVMNKTPFLEELDISHCCHVKVDFFDYIGQFCPLLKSLKFSPSYLKVKNKDDNAAFAIAKTMSELRHLTIITNGLSNDGLLAILDGCPLLESLDVRGCLHLDMNESLKKRCNEQIKELILPTEFIDQDFSFVHYMNHLCIKYNSNLNVSDFSWIDKIPY